MEKSILVALKVLSFFAALYASLILTVIAYKALPLFIGETLTGNFSPLVYGLTFSAILVIRLKIKV